MEKMIAKKRRTKDKIASRVHDLGEYISNKFFLSLPFTPTQLNLIGFFFMALAAFCFSRGVWKVNYLALAFIIISVQLDYADGIVARARNLTNRFGAWFDPFLDLVGQQLVYLGISFGVLKNYNYQSLVVLICFLGFWSIALNNFIGHQFTQTFGFDSYTGHLGFTDKFQALKRTSFAESFLFNVIAPHSFLYFVLFTIRYFLLIGIFFNQMILSIALITFFGLLKAFIMILVYILYLKKNNNNKIIKILLELEK